MRKLYQQREDYLTHCENVLDLIGAFSAESCRGRRLVRQAVLAESQHLLTVPPHDNTGGIDVYAKQLKLASQATRERLDALLEFDREVRRDGMRLLSDVVDLYIAVTGADKPSAGYDAPLDDDDDGETGGGSGD